MNWQAVEATGTIAGALLAAGTLMWGFHGVKSQMWLATFADFTKRYADIVDRLPSEMRVPGDFVLHGLSREEEDKVFGALRRYFNLCSEEHYLAQRRILDSQTWKIWTTGIQDALRNSGFKDAWKLLRVEYEYYPAFCAFMDELVAQTKVTQS